MIFKCVINVMELSFNLIFTSFCTYEFHEQYTDSQKKAKRSNFHFSMQSKLNPRLPSHYICYPRIKNLM